MDGTGLSISPQDLYALVGTAAAPAVIDVRRSEAITAAGRLIAGATHRPADDVEQWRDDFPSDQRIIVYCQHGRELSQRAARMLRTVGLDAIHVEGGIDAWQACNLPTRRILGSDVGRWVTRERPKIDRIACPWLIQRFINPRATFLYVPASEVIAVAEDTGAIPFDIEGVELAHEGERCSFDTILRIFDIQDPALDRLATIVRGADTSRHDLAPQCGGLFAISLGLSANFGDDHEMLAHGLVIYDALYTWFRNLQAEAHNWPAKVAPIRARGD